MPQLFPLSNIKIILNRNIYESLMYRLEAEAAISKSYTNTDFQDWVYRAISIYREDCRNSLKKRMSGGITWEVNTRSWPKHVSAILKYIITLCNTANVPVNIFQLCLPNIHYGNVPSTGLRFGSQRLKNKPLQRCSDNDTYCTIMCVRNIH